MSYVRPASKNEVIRFLENHFGEALQPIVLDGLAAALIQEWDLVGVFPTPKGA